MDGAEFDAWTRRKLGLAGGLFAALLGLGIDPAGAGKKGKNKKKNKRRKKQRRCIEEGDTCAPSSANCCDGLPCVWDPLYYGEGKGGAYACGG
jgi:hypothetical protein